MRAIAIDQYGNNELLRLKEVPDPKVGPDFVLIRAKAVSVNPVDWKVVRGYLDGAFNVHFPLIPCWDVAGVVEAIGPAVVGFEVGDEVIAYNRQDQIQWGTLSELVSAPFRCVAHKPESVDFVHAAAIPLAGLTAFQVVHDTLGVKSGETVLVHAASGGVGTFATQLARHAGARVIGTASERNHDYLRSLDVEPVAYGEGVVERVRELAPDGVDAIVDLVGGDALVASKEMLATDGRLASIIDSKTVLSMGGRYVFVHPDAAQLNQLSELVDKGVIKINIEKTFSLVQTGDAFAAVENGHVRGKVAITI